MKEDLIKNIVESIKKVIEHLICQEFDELEKLGIDDSLDGAEELLFWIKESRLSLIYAPAEAYSSIEISSFEFGTKKMGFPVPAGSSKPNLIIYECKDENDNTVWTVNFDVWTLEQGRSGFCLEIDFYERPDSSLKMVVQDLFEYKPQPFETK